MRIGLINAYSTLNLGDAAIYSAFRKLLPGVDLVGCVQDERPDPTLGVTFLPERPRNCEAYISVGGDIFNNSREWFVTKAFLMNLAELRHSARHTFLFGQSIPRSCHGLSFFLLQRYFKRLAAVCVRDAESHQRLCAAGVPARLSFDIAFVLESSPLRRQRRGNLLNVWRLILPRPPCSLCVVLTACTATTMMLSSPGWPSSVLNSTLLDSGPSS